MARFRFAGEGCGGPKITESTWGLVVTELSDLSSDSLRLLLVEDDFPSKLSFEEGWAAEAFLGLKYSSIFADLVSFDLGAAGFFGAIMASIKLRISRSALNFISPRRRQACGLNAWGWSAYDN